MDTGDTEDADWYLDATRREGTALAAVARAAGMGASVPSCPGWTVADLVEHAGSVHRHVALIVRGRLDAPLHDPPGPPRGADLIDWYQRGLAELLDVLAATDPATPVWTWDPTNRTAGFWRRRMAHETAVHRVDADGAAGRAGTVEPRLAADGVGEVLAVFIGDDPDSEHLGDRVGTVHVHATDAEGEWLGTLHRNALVVRHGHGKADAAVRGRASDLLLWLWGRAPLDALEVFGDRAIATGVRALAAEVMT